MKKIFILLVALLALAIDAFAAGGLWDIFDGGRTIRPVRPWTLRTYDNSTMATESYTDAALAGLELGDIGGVTDTGTAYDFDKPIEAPGITFDDEYGSAIIWNLPSSTMLPPLSKAAGIFLHKGIAYTRALVGGVWKYYTMAGVNIENNIAEQFYCDDAADATYAMPTSTTWANQVNGFELITSAGTAPVFSISGTSNCHTLKSTSAAGYFAKAYLGAINGDDATVFVDGKAARIFFRVRFNPTGPNSTYQEGAGPYTNFPLTAVGIGNNAGEDAIYVGVSYVAGVASNAKVWVRKGSTTFTGILHTTVDIADATDFVDIEIAPDGSSGYDVYIDGIKVCDEATTQTLGTDMSIQAFNLWDSTGGTENTYTVGPAIMVRSSNTGTNTYTGTNFELAHSIYQQEP